MSQFYKHALIFRSVSLMLIFLAEGNVSAVIRDIGMVTLQTLEDFGIPYHE